MTTPGDYFRFRKPVAYATVKRDIYDTDNHRRCDIVSVWMRYFDDDWLYGQDLCVPLDDGDDFVWNLLVESDATLHLYANGEIDEEWKTRKARPLLCDDMLLCDGEIVPIRWSELQKQIDNMTSGREGPLTAPDAWAGGFAENH